MNNPSPSEAELRKNIKKSGMYLEWMRDELPTPKERERYVDVIVENCKRYSEQQALGDEAHHFTTTAVDKGEWVDTVTYCEHCGLTPKDLQKNAIEKTIAERGLVELCWVQEPGKYLACDRKQGHQGLHTWEGGEG